MTQTSYDELIDRLTARYKKHTVGLTFLESHTAGGYCYELFATVEKNEIDTRFFIIVPGGLIVQPLLSDFKEMLRERDKIVTEVVEGTVYGQGIFMFRIVMANVTARLTAHLVDPPAPKFYLIAALEELERSYRHLLWMGDKFVAGEMIRPTPEPSEEPDPE